MNDDEIKKILSAYVDEEMSLLDNMDLPEYEHEFSKDYNKKIRKMFRVEKHFHQNIHLAHTLRRVAIIALAVIGLISAGVVSAHVFGYHPWSYKTHFEKTGKMEERIYEEPITPSDDADYPTAAKDMPSNIPKKYIRFSGIKTEDDIMIVYTPNNEKSKKCIQYDRYKIVEGMVTGSNGEYETKEAITIKGYVGYYYTRGTTSWIIWDDTTYNYYMATTHIKESKSLLLDLANNIYE